MTIADIMADIMEAKRDMGVGAVVVTHDGLRLSWKAARGVPPRLGRQYFGGFTPEDCVVHTGKFDSFNRAEEWARSFARHPEALGFEP